MEPRVAAAQGGSTPRPAALSDNLPERPWCGARRNRFRFSPASPHAASFAKSGSMEESAVSIRARVTDRALVDLAMSTASEGAFV